MNPLLEFIKRLRERFAPRVVGSWLVEFGYARDAMCDHFVGLSMAAQERGPRLERELDAHGKRLAERAQMSAAPAGRARVIR